MLTKGYVDGLLTFKYPNKLSRSREEYLLTVLERQETLEVLKVKAIVDTSLLSVVSKPETIDKAFNSMKNYVQMALPYISQKDNIEDIKMIDKNELKSIKESLTRKRKNKDSQSKS